MSRPTIVVVENPQSAMHRSDAAQELLDRFADVRRVFLHPELTEPERDRLVDEQLADADGLLLCGWNSVGIGYLSAERLDRCPNLRFIASTSHYRQAWWVDMDAALARGITFSETAPAMSPWVAEYEFGLCFAALRDIPQDHELVGRGRWLEFPETKDSFDRLEGRRVGLVSFGEIHRHLARYLAPFGTDWEAFDPFVGEEAIAEAGGRKADDLVAMASRSEIFFVAAPPTPQTEGLVSREVIEALPHDAVFVLVGRMIVVDSEALIERLQRGDLRLATDVYDPDEPPAADSPLRTLPNVVHTPHRGGNTHAAQRAIFLAECEDARRFFAGEPVRHPIRQELAALFSK
jgi:phosphoglycerate dehydrogenase-like enzyme